MAKATPNSKKEDDLRGFFMPLEDIEQVLTSLGGIPVGQVFNVYHYFFSKKLEVTNPQLLVAPKKSSDKGGPAQN